MKKITSYDIDDALYPALQKEANRCNLSLDEYILTLLRSRSFDDLEQLAGTWNQKEFEIELQRQRPIDPTLWQ